MICNKCGAEVEYFIEINIRPGLPYYYYGCPECGQCQDSDAVFSKLEELIQLYMNQYNFTRQDAVKELIKDLQCLKKGR